MCILNSIFNPWIYCGISRPYRRAYIFVLRRVGRVCGVPQAGCDDTLHIGDENSLFKTSGNCYNKYMASCQITCNLSHLVMPRLFIPEDKARKLRRLFMPPFDFEVENHVFCITLRTFHFILSAASVPYIASFGLFKSELLLMITPCN